MGEEKNIKLTRKERYLMAKFCNALFNATFDSLKAVEEVAKENKKLLESNYQHVGKIIHCHLVIENLMNRILVEANPGPDFKLPLTFFQKVRLLPYEKKFYKILKEGLYVLNKLRNNLAHNLNYEITKEDIEIFDKYMLFLKVEDVSKLTSEEKVQKFTELCIFLFSLHSSKVRMHWTDFSKDYSEIYIELSELAEHLNLDKYRNGEKDNE